MKIGIRKPNLKKRIKARTTGKIKRKVKSSINPLYGKKGVGFIKNPKKSIKNKIYKKTTIGIGTGGSGNSGLLYMLFIGWWIFLFKWMLIGIYNFYKWIFYTMPKYLITKYKGLSVHNKSLVKAITFSFFTIMFAISSISLLSQKEIASFFIGFIITLVLGYFSYKSIRSLFDNAETNNMQLEDDDIVVSNNYID